MNEAGIVRRIDDLGRIVIPKEIRNTLRIREGDSLQITVDENKIIRLEKYEPMSVLLKNARMCIELVSDLTNFSIFITDRENVVAASKNITNEVLNKRISNKLREKIENRINWATKQSSPITLIEEDNIKEYKSQLVVPIVTNADVVGSVVIFSTSLGNIVSENEEKIAMKIAKILAKELE